MQRRRIPRWTSTATALVLIAGLFVADRFGLFRESAGDRPADRRPGTVATTPSAPSARLSAVSGDRVIEDAFRERASGVWVESSGTVLRELPDDDHGDPHQRFIVRLATGRTLLCAHNLTLATRVPVEPEDVVEFAGRYEWNEEGGVLHWTHDDPSGHRTGGWIRHEGQLYE